MKLPRTRTWLALLTAVTLVAGLIAWRVVASSKRPSAHATPDMGHMHDGPVTVVHPASYDVETKAAGDWSDPHVWSTGAVPTANDVVHVTHAVRMDAAAGDAKELWLEAPLTFAMDRSTQLTMHGSLVVDRGGAVRIGRVGNPIPARFTAALRFDVKDEQAMKGGFVFTPGDPGLWGLPGGSVELHGSPVRETWSKLAAPVSAGDTSLATAIDVSDWPGGVEAVLTATNLGRKDQNEQVEVTKAVAISGGGAKLTLGKPVQFDHLGGPDFAGEVGLLTHNVKVESLDPENRAHVFFFGGSHAGISSTQFDRMGPYNQFSRYALHFHMMGDSSEGMEVRGCSFRGSGTYWLNIHGSNGMTVEDNVGYLAHGAGFYMEHPAGIGNTWLHNLGVDVAPSVKLQQRNAVFWLLLGNALIDNVAVGANGGADSSGIFIPQQPRDDPALKHPTVVLHDEAHSNQQYGFASWMNLSPDFDVVDLNLWHNRDSGFHWGAYGTHFKAYRVRAVDNGEADIQVQVKGMYLQDSELSGAAVGMFFANPVVDTNPENPSRVVRTTFADHAEHDVAIDDVRTCSRTTGRCPPMYLQFVDSTFRSSDPIHFGWQWDAKTRLWFQNATATDRSDLPRTFVLVRDDQPKPSPDAQKDPQIGAWVSPTGPVVQDVPPTAAAPVVSRDGSEWRLDARVGDDASVARVEFLVNGIVVGSRAGPGPDVTFRFVGPAPDYGFVTVRVTDDAGNVAYSPTVAL